jgi:hypothetical protein
MEREKFSQTQYKLVCLISFIYHFVIYIKLKMKLFYFFLLKKLTNHSKSKNEMTTFWATMLLQTSKKQDFLQNLYFKYFAICSPNPDINRIRCRNRNFFGVGTGSGINSSGSGINSSGSTTLLYMHYIHYRNNLELALQKSNPPRQVSSPFSPASRQSRNSQIHSTENTVEDIDSLTF